MTTMRGHSPPAQQSGSIVHYFSLASPWAWLGAARVQALAKACGVGLISRPISTLTDHGWIPLVDKPAPRQAYVMADLRRWADHLQIAMVTGTDRPAAQAGLVPALPMVWALQASGEDPLPLAMALQKAWWESCTDVGQPGLRAEIASRAGYDGAALLAAEEAPSTLAQGQANFDAARADGVFGSPFYLWNGEAFWGQDRLDFLAAALERAGLTRQGAAA